MHEIQLLHTKMYEIPTLWTLQWWWRGDVAEHIIGIDCDGVSLLVALDVRAVVRG